jgi:hypothetical protein
MSINNNNEILFRELVQHEREQRELWEREHDKQTVLALGQMERRLNGMNELRDQISHERGDYIDKSWYLREHKTLQDRLAADVSVLSDKIEEVKSWVTKLSVSFMGALLLLLASVIVKLIWK